MSPAPRHPCATISTRRRCAPPIVLALVLALDATDHGAVGALAPSLNHDFGITNTDLGLPGAGVDHRRSFRPWGTRWAAERAAR